MALPVTDEQHTHGIASIQQRVTTRCADPLPSGKWTIHGTMSGYVLNNDELTAIYQRAKIVVFPSVVSDDGDREGFGLVLVEAMGCGCAAVVTDLSAMMDIVQGGKTAIVVRQKNPDEIATAVIRLLNDPELRSAMAREGRRKVLESFDWRVIVPRYRAVLDTAIKAAGSGLAEMELICVAGVSAKAKYTLETTSKRN